MFRKILIANRGEIACRIIRTARAMGIGTVAVYSEADRDSLAVAQANEAVAIGPAAPQASYLVIDNMLAALHETGADAVHPGFGFLSENAAFAEAVAAAGATFIGPPPAAIAAMGDKLAAKRLAAAAGVTILSGHPDAIDSAAAAVGHAGAIGYPVMLKAAAGGGGKGVRVAHDEAALRAGFESARNEARSSFADERVFLEKYVDEPASYRDPSRRRCPWRYYSSGRARVLDPAPSPEGDRRSAVAAPRRRHAGGDGRTGRRAGQGGRLSVRRHG